MGYYSIYKIFKDIIRTLFGRKFFKFLLVFVIVFVILTLLIKCQVFGYSTTDVQNYYENNVISDFIKLYNNFIDNGFDTDTTMQDFQKYMLMDNYSYLVGYSSSIVSGSSLTPTTDVCLNGYYGTAVSNRKYMYVLIYNSYASYLTTNDTGDVWYNMSNVPYEKFASGSGYIFYFNTGANPTSITKYSVTSSYLPNFRMPVDLYRYSSSNLYNVLHDTTSSDILAILGSINNNIEETNDFLQSTEVDESNVVIDTSSNDDVSDSSFTTFFSDVLSSIQNSFTYNDDDVITISIPFWTYSITISSDTFRKFITSNYTNYAFYNIVHVFYYFVFARYIIAFVYNFIKTIKTGDFMNGKYQTWTAFNEII